MRTLDAVKQQKPNPLNSQHANTINKNNEEDLLLLPHGGDDMEALKNHLDQFSDVHNTLPKQVKKFQMGRFQPKIDSVSRKQRVQWRPSS